MERYVFYDRLASVSERVFMILLSWFGFYTQTIGVAKRIKNFRIRRTTGATSTR